MTLCRLDSQTLEKDLINMMSPSKNSKLIDVACGTGDIGKLFGALIIMV